MVREQTFDKLYRLKLHGVAAALEEQFKNPETDALASKSGWPYWWTPSGCGVRTGPSPPGCCKPV